MFARHLALVPAERGDPDLPQLNAGYYIPAALHRVYGIVVGALLDISPTLFAVPVFLFFV